MIIQQIKNIKSGKKEIRSFTVIMAVVLAAIGCYLLWRDSRYYQHFLIAAGMFLVLGLTIPIILKPVHKIWMAISIVIGMVMTAVILAVLFYVIVTPAGLIARLCGKRFLNTQFDSKAESYWVTKESFATDKGQYERQF